MNVKADFYHSRPTPEAFMPTPNTIFHDSPRRDHMSYRGRHKIFRKEPMLSSIFSENEGGKKDETRFTMEGWNKKNNNVELKKPTQNDSLEDLETSSQESLLEGSCRQNIFKNELTNLSNGLFSMHLKDTKMNNISKPYFQSVGLKPNSRPVSVLQGRKLHGASYMSQEKRSVSYVVKEKGKIDGDMETIEAKQEDKIEGKKEKVKGKDKEKVEKGEKEKEKDKEKGSEKENIKKERKKDKRKEKEKEKERDIEVEKEAKSEEIKTEKAKKIEVEKVIEKEKKVELEKVIEKEKEKEKPKITIPSTKDLDNNKEKEKDNDKDKEKEKEKEKTQEKPKEKTLERQQNVMLAKCKFQEKYIKEQQELEKEKKLDLKKRVSGKTKVIDFTTPIIKQKELPNKKLYLKVIQMLEKAKKPDDRSSTGINSSTDVLVQFNPAEITEFTPNKLSSRHHKALMHSSPPPKHHSNACLTSAQQEQSEPNKGLKNETNLNLSPNKEAKTPSKFRTNIQGHQLLPAIENNPNNKSLNSITKSMQVSARACHKIGKVNQDKFSNSMINPHMSEDMESSEVIQQKNQSMVLEDNRDHGLRMQYHSQRSTDAYGQPSQAISRNDEDSFIPYLQQQPRHYQAILEPEKRETELQGKVRGQGRSSSVNQSKVYGQLEGKMKLKDGPGVKFHVFQLPLPSIQSSIQPVLTRELLTLPVKKDKGMKRYKKKEIVGVEDFFKKEEEVETERDIRSYFVKPKVEYLRGGGIRGLSYHKASLRMSNDASENKDIVMVHEDTPGRKRLAPQDSTDKMLYLEESVKFMNEDSTEEDL